MEVIEIRQKKIISIHAPTRGATDEIIRNQFIEDISIHAPTRGATDEIIRNQFIEDISIHAPTRGATSDSYIQTAARRFQSTLLQEERLFRQLHINRS